MALSLNDLGVAVAADVTGVSDLTVGGTGDRDGDGIGVALIAGRIIGDPGAVGTVQGGGGCVSGGRQVGRLAAAAAEEPVVEEAPAAEEAAEAPAAE